MRIIQDSEDEDDLEVEDAAAPERDAPPEHNNSNASPSLGEKGTGSTESLKRAIVAAHRAQFREESCDRPGQSNPSEAPSAANISAVRSQSHDAPQSSISLPGHASKRRRTSLDGAVPLCSARDVLPATFDERHPQQTLHNTNTHLAGIAERPWDFQGTMRNDWEDHEPMGLFAQTLSSTIPNATATQQQLLAEVLAPEFLHAELELDPDAPRYEPAKSSVPWSEYLKSSSKVPEVPPQSTEQLPSLSQNHAFHPTCPVGSPSCFEPRAESPDPLHSPIVEPMSNVEAAASELELQSSMRPPVAPASGKTEQKPSSVPDSEDDLITMGVQLEQYKPRPSRSRSLKLNMEESIDYSQRPERVAKKTRRTRTTGEAETTSTATTPEKVRQICDMGFTLLSTQKALRQHNGDVTHTVNWLIANGIPAEDELMPPKSSKLKNKKKSKLEGHTQDLTTDMYHGEIVEAPTQEQDAPVDASTAVISEDILEPASTTSIMKSPMVVKVVIPGTKKPITPSKNIESQSTALAVSDLVSESTSEMTAKQQDAFDRPDLYSKEQAVAAKQPPNGKKRGRGRPRKEARTVVSIGEDPETSTSKRDASVINADEELDDKTHKPDEPQVSGADSTKIDAVIDHTTPAPPLLPQKKIKNTHETPSSTGTGKTPYRVGLSRRARIAPLLRIVKK